MQTQQEENIGYRITQIKTHKIAIVEPDNIDFDNLTVSGQVIFSVKALHEGIFEISFDIVSEYVDNVSTEILISHIGRTRYETNNLLICSGKEVLNIPDQLMVMFYEMAYTHARALLASALQNTVYKDKVFTPVIDPKNILNLE